MDSYYDKLKALLEGLEIEHIEELLANEDVKAYRLIGIMIAKQNKMLQKQLESENESRTN